MSVDIKIPLHTGVYPAGLEGAETFEAEDSKVRLENLDPIDAATSLLLHLDGADGSQTFRDATNNEKDFKAIRDAEIDTAQSVFGGASLLLDGAGDNIQITKPGAGFNFGNGEFTIDFRVRFNFLPTPGNTDQFYSRDVFPGFDVGLDIVNVGGIYTVRFIVYSGGGANVAQNVWTTPVINTFYHMAFVRSGDLFLIFVVGTLLGAGTTFAGLTIDTVSGPLNIGARLDDRFINGWFDEFRVTKGVARWTANFTPPTQAYGALYASTSPATTGQWTPLPVGTLALSTARLIIFKDGVVQAATSTDVNIRYYDNNGAASAWMTLEDLRLESDITITDETNSIKMETQYISDESYQSESTAFITMEYTQDVVPPFSASYELPEEIILEDEEVIIFEGCE